MGARLDDIRHGSEAVVDGNQRLSPAPVPAHSLRGRAPPAAGSGTRVLGHSASVGARPEPSIGTSTPTSVTAPDRAI